jgi:hypothetical protein
LREAVTGFVAYFGTYDVDEAAHTVTHHVEASLVPSWVGTDVKRQFNFQDGRLLLTAAAPDGSSSYQLGGSVNRIEAMRPIVS